VAAPAPALAASELFIRGAGYGHGVGMSQYGAYGYALHGANYATILAHYYTGTALGTVDPNELVTVLIATGRAAFTGAGSAGNVNLEPGSTYQVRALADGRLALVGPGGSTVGRFSAPLTASGAGPLTVPGLGAYRGSLEFLPGGSGGVQTINAVGLDDYVRGVVAAEMPSSWSTQALEAQAVAARTYAITTDAGGSAFDQYSDTRSQVYDGVRAETPSTDAAVAATRGQVVTDLGYPVTTYFFSSSGGYTENNENVWSGSQADPWLRGVADPYDDAGNNPYYRWHVYLGGARAAAELGSLVDGRLIGIAPIEVGVSTRIVTAEVVGSGGTRSATGAQLEQRLGLNSTLAEFRDITTVALVIRSHAGRAAVPAGRGFPAAIVRSVNALAARVLAAPSLAGTVFPGRPHAPILVQEYRAGAWTGVTHARLGAGGAYSVRPRGHGVYRIVYYGLDGPAVTL
jgi:stage II sporulation protein D